MERYLGALLLILLVILVKNTWLSPAILGTSTVASTNPTDALPIHQPVITQSSFTTKLEEVTEKIAKSTVYQDDSEIEAGEEKVLEEGEDGKKEKVYQITYTKDGKEFEKELISEDITLPKDKKIIRGTKIVWRALNTNDGEIKYWKKMRVYATHYDSHCLGCDEWTATGMRQGKGVIAVDPKVIPLRSKLYIPGYGIAVAGDTGGAIKGKIIDLGFEDAKTAGWYAHFIDIYLL